MRIQDSVYKELNELLYKIYYTELSFTDESYVYGKIHEIVSNTFEVFYDSLYIPAEFDYLIGLNPRQVSPVFSIAEMLASCGRHESFKMRHVFNIHRFRNYSVEKRNLYYLDDEPVESNEPNYRIYDDNRTFPPDRDVGDIGYDNYILTERSRFTSTGIHYMEDCELAFESRMIGDDKLEPILRQHYILKVEDNY